MIAVVDYKKGNLKSVERGLIAAGADARITSDANEIAQAEAIVLPGVGAFTDAMNTMEELGQAEVLRDAFKKGVPFLGICLGLHLMFEEGEEHAVGNSLTPGLGLLPGVARKMPRTDSAGKPYKVPHVGWNSIEFDSESPLLEGIEPGEHFYFTHSYVAPASSATIATTQHSVTFPSAVALGNAFGVQFHPEKSSDAGARVLSNFTNIVRASN